MGDTPAEGSFETRILSHHSRTACSILTESPANQLSDYVWIGHTKV
jgi:hypothetical protein